MNPNERTEENSRTTNPTSPHDASHGNSDTQFTRILPRNPQRLNARGSSRNGSNVRGSLSSHRSTQPNPGNDLIASRPDTQFPNIRFRNIQRTSDPVQSNSPTSSSENRNGGLTSSSNNFTDNTSSLNRGTGAASVSRHMETGNRFQPSMSVSSNNTTSTSQPSPKRRSGTSPRRSHRRSSSNNSNSFSTPQRTRPQRSRGSYQTRASARLVDIEDDSSDDDFNRMLAEMPSIPRFGVVSGLGTQDQPFELLNDSDAASPSGGPVAESVLRDEELARQMQQEEWERASTPAAPSRLQFLQAVHGALGGGFRPSPSPPPPHRRGNLIHLPMLVRSSRGRQPRSSLPERMDFLDFLPPELMEYIISNGQFLQDENNYEALLEMGDQIGAVSQGLSRRDINKIPVQTHRSSSASVGEGASSEDSSSTQCSICLSDFNVGDTKRILPCQHELHKDCIDQWLKTSATCPICRKDIREDQEART